jgi:hypothetical protein
MEQDHESFTPVDVSVQFLGEVSSDGNAALGAQGR